jgi:hypothetical protein
VDLARRLRLLGAAIGAACAAHSGAADVREPPIESCVSANTIEFDAADQHVTLEPADAARVQAEMQQRYPVLQRDGFPVSKIVLWHKASGESLFITLLEHPSKADRPCFTATFSAARFNGIEQLKRKYLRPEQSI